MEGPQVRALADRIHALVAGRAVDRIDVPADRWQANVLLKHCAGRQVIRVQSRGQWLIWDFSHGISWVFFPLRQWRWSLEDPLASASPAHAPLAARSGKRPLLRLALSGGRVLTLSGRPIFLLLMTDAVLRHPALKDLGPDILDLTFTIPEWVRRIRAARPQTISRTLINPAIACGIGNELKCETLFTARLHPACPVSTLPAAALEKCLTVARQLSEAAYSRAMGNPLPLHDHPRVHDRAGEPCDLCGTPIEADHSGADGHWSWFCPTCQAPQLQPNLFARLPHAHRAFD